MIELTTRPSGLSDAREVRLIFSLGLPRTLVMVIPIRQPVRMEMNRTLNIALTGLEALEEQKMRTELGGDSR